MNTFNFRVPAEASNKDPSTPSKHVTFNDTVEWASESNSGKEESSSRKYTFWLMIVAVVAIVVIIWVIIKFMSKSNSKSKDKKGTNGKTEGSILDGMSSESGSIRPDSGRNYRKKHHKSSSHRNHRSNKGEGGGRGEGRGGGSTHYSMVSPLPPNDF